MLDSAVSVSIPRCKGSRGRAAVSVGSWSACKEVFAFPWKARNSDSGYLVENTGRAMQTVRAAESIETERYPRPRRDFGWGLPGLGSWRAIGTRNKQSEDCSCV